MYPLRVNEDGSAAGMGEAGLVGCALGPFCQVANPIYSGNISGRRQWRDLCQR